MNNFKKILTYVILLPILFIQFSCDDTPADSTVHNGDIVGSWMLTDLTGTYTYTVALPNNATWNPDTSFGIHMQGEHHPLVGVNYAHYLLPIVTAGDTIPGVTQTAIYNIDSLRQDTIGLIGVFEDAPSAGAYATYKMKGVYPSVGYNYSTCTAGGAGTSLDKPDMGDQGIYTWDQTSTTENFVIKRDPAIGGEQVLPAFNDGTLIFTDETLDILNIKFKDRDAHDSLFAEIPDQAWDEGAHPSVNNKDSGGDRSYMAFPPVLAVGTMPDGYGPTFLGAYIPGDPVFGTPDMGEPAYLYNPALAAWGNYMTWNAWCFMGEMQYRAATLAITDANANGLADELITYMVTKMAEDTANGTDLAKTHGANIPYATLITTVGTGTEAVSYPTNDSMNDFSDGGGNGRLKYTITGADCAVPANVTIDFDATFTRCTTDNCVGDDYHVTPDWD